MEEIITKERERTDNRQCQGYDTNRDIHPWNVLLIGTRPLGDAYNFSSLGVHTMEKILQKDQDQEKYAFFFIFIFVIFIMVVVFTFTKGSLSIYFLSYLSSLSIENFLYFVFVIVFL